MFSQIAVIPVSVIPAYLKKFRIPVKNITYAENSIFNSLSRRKLFNTAANFSIPWSVMFVVLERIISIFGEKDFYKDQLISRFCKSLRLVRDSLKLINAVSVTFLHLEMMRLTFLMFHTS